ncbi:RNA-directed DNA polymerase (reverse transcriptase)-related family protein [Rhynchospora pubera]|uniref:RNA-directed DNA polymerase (Reverse transcriptase)-related family protein n=1 Tax=Rhynchospora pubera TaxID=906938 RepID=A0AAV8F7X7_9POAL|nr:RNA-directed DNA polymerase (reverse transcriptase)-related family protein [Rhynchospora pubera]KAJ4816138.1 RNA-directed DNA polymerase (reverse transcriptase)-related family protein [Rhynchospora pubera]
MMARELVSFFKRNKVPAVIYKVDFAKAFDTVSWTFLSNVLIERGFPPLWCGWVINLLKSSASALKVNGQLTDSFMHRRGLRQGDPLSPLLFIIVVDALQSFISNASPLLSGPVIIPPKALQFADDTLILMEALPRNLRVISAILSHFSQLSGLIINSQKSVFVPIALSQSEIQIAREILECSNGNFPLTYLGLPLSYRKPKKIHFLPLIRSLHDRLQGWKSKLLSLGGRLVMIKSVLTALPLHFMQVFKLPKWLLNEIEKICRAFLWKGSATCHGGKCLVNWDRCCLPKQCGGLGILHLQTQNDALLIKWLWKLVAERNSAWSTLIRTLYGTVDIEALSTVDRMSVALKEILLAKQFFLSSIEFHPGDDIPRWRWARKGAFTAKSAYSILRDPGMRSPYYNHLWKAKAPLKVKIFFWIALLDRLLTRENMHYKGWAVPRDCVLCQNNFETGLHLFAQCPFAGYVWNCFIHPGVSLQIGEKLCDVWLLNRQLLKTNYKDNWDTVWLAGAWNLWKMRCSVIFEGALADADEVIRKTIRDCKDWISYC